MKHGGVIRCPVCECEDLRKNGHSTNNVQRWYCKDCKKYFQRSFTYKGCLPEVKEQVIEMAKNGSGIRNTARVLGISPHTVINEIKKSLKNLLLAVP